MIIKLKEITVIYICPDYNEKYHNRKVHMDQLLNELKFKNVIHYKSSNEKYPHCLNNATIDILSKYKPPFLLLEDDIKDTQNIPDILEIPDNTDAFYLGLSSGGGHISNNYDDGDSQFEHINDNLYKVKNMLCTHAILYITSNYILNVRNQLITKPDYYNDVVISQIQNKFNIYCHHKSYFYQAKELEGHEKATTIILKQNLIIYVTAFININDSPIEYIEKNYFYYFKKLAQTGIKIALFLDTKYKEYGDKIMIEYPNVDIVRYLTKDELYINKLNISNELPKIRNVKKDNEDYLKLMNNKIYFVEEVMNKYDYDYYSWIDFRIFHIFNDTNIINTKFKKLANTYHFSKSAYFPGAYNTPRSSMIIEEINWRFLGGFFMISKSKIKTLVDETTKLLESLPKLTWEVNIWSVLEHKNLFNFGWYEGDHNESILL
jgi:hypothetical protein